MNIAFIIAEYNPFHNGHRYHIEQTKKNLNADCIVAVMSGNFVQRGDIAIGDKFLRAETAVIGGADLVVELPVKYAVANASHFAEGAIKTIKAFGLPGALSFGASATTDELERLCKIIFSEDFLLKTAQTSKSFGLSYPAAKAEVLRASGYYVEAELLKDPNNILAVEYIKNITNDSILTPFCVSRTENVHDSDFPSDGFASAKYIRNLIYSENSDGLSCELNTVDGYLPEKSLQILKKEFDKGYFPVNKNKYETVAFARLLLFDEQYFLGIDNVNQGIENKIVKAVKQSASLDELYKQIKSKRFTLSRMRQIITQAVLGVKKEDTLSDPSYLRVLAFNDKGRTVLNLMRSSAALPIATNLSDISDNTSCTNDFLLEYTADKIFDLCLKNPKGGNRPFLEHPVYVKQTPNL